MDQNPDRLFNFSDEKLALLDLLLAEEGVAETAVPTIPAYPRTGERLPLSFAQQRLWFLDSLARGSSLFNTPLALRLSGHLDGAGLARACQALVQRHESLRTTFTAEDGRPYQIVHPESPVNLIRIPVDLGEVESALQTAVQQPFDLESGPLVRFYLGQVEENEHILLIVFHHIIFDGWSARTVVEDLFCFYEAFCQNREPALPQLPIQFADYARWQQEMLTGDTLQVQLDYWQDRLAGELPVLQLPTDNPRPSEKSHAGARFALSLSQPLSQRLEALCRETAVTPFMLLLASFKVLLHRWTGQEDILVGTPIANRQQAEVANLIGFFVNTLVLRSEVNGWMPFRGLLAQVRAEAASAYEHQDAPFEKLVELLQPARNLGYDPLFQVMFVFQDEPAAMPKLPDLKIGPLDLDNGMAQFDLTLAVSCQDGRFCANLNYNTAVFKRGTIERLLNHWQTLLEGIVADPDCPVGRLPLLTAEEMSQLLSDWNQTDIDWPMTGFTHELIARQAAERPHSRALVFGDRQLSYAQLNGRANQLAYALQARGIGPETRVGIFINRSPEMILALLAVFKAGGAYVPLDPAYPPERLDYMIGDAGLSLILTTLDLRPKLSGQVTDCLCLDVEWANEIAHLPSENPTVRLLPDNLAYIIYTSGSTGRPKGVGVTHRGLANMAQALAKALALTVDTRLLQFASFSFDASVAEVLVALQNGAALVMARADDILLGPEFVAYVQQQQISAMILPPSVLALLSPKDFPQLRTVVSAGEACSAEIVTRWAPGRRFVNGYGPTEGTVAATTAVLTEEADKPAIGRPLPNTRAYLLNEQLQPVPVGVPGEIHLAGPGLARGYLNRPDITAEKFIPNPFAGRPGERLYKTGDLGRYLPDGRIEYLGRKDHQVKIRGFRLELGEIESALRQHPAVQDALVVTQGSGLEVQLVAYVVSEAATLTDLRPFLEKTLPAHMIPAAFVPLGQFPLTPNGKIDRKALPLPGEWASGSTKETFMAPQDALEAQLAQIWQKILRLPEISTEVNYFELGGHSLQAVTLFAAIEKQLSLRLPVSLLFQAPTIRQLAAAIRRQANTPEWSSLVPIQRLGAKTPLFCVHGGAGHVFHYHELAQLLGTERPFYGLRPKVDEITHQSVHKNVAEMAAHYIREMKMVQPEGPYLLSGFCFGGIVAYEIAQQLVLAGDEVGLLVFIDPSTPQNLAQTSTEPSKEQLAGRWSRHRQEMDQLGQMDRLRYILNSSKNRLASHWNNLSRAWLRHWRVLGAKGLQKYIIRHAVVPSRFKEFYFMHVITSAATAAYHPQPYPGKAVLFYSTLENSGDESLGWAGLPEGGLECHAIESTHLGILKRPFIEQVAAKLRHILEPIA